MKFTRHLFIAVLLFLSALPAFADNKPGAVVLSPYVGGFTFSGGKDHFDTDLTEGVRTGYNFNPNLGAEVQLGYSDTKHDPGNRHVNLLKFGAQALYHFQPDRKLTPFLAAGASGLSSNHTASPGTRVYPCLDYGFGVKYSMNDALALRCDFRHALIFGNAPSSYHFEYTLGIAYQIGGR